MQTNAPKVKFFENHNGESIAYAVHGTGPALVLPAWWVSHLELDWQQPAFQRFLSQLGEHHTIVRYDRAGSGLSDRNRRVFTLADEVQTLTGLIDHLQLDECALFGVSCGGPPAMLYALARPERVSRLVFFGSFVAGHHIASQEIQDALSGLVSAYWGLGAKAILDLFDPSMPAAERQNTARVHRDSTSAEMADALMKLTFAMDASDAASHLDMPALVMHRIKDQTITFDAGRKLAAVLNQSELVALEGNTHLPWSGPDADAIATRMLLFTGALSPPKAPVAAHSPNQFRATGDVWTLCFADQTVHLKESLGLIDIAQLIAARGQEIHASELAGQGNSLPAQHSAEVLDETAIKSFQSRLGEIEDEKSSAGEAGDDAAYARLEAEYDAIVNTLTQGVGFGGRHRRFPGDGEKARKAVSARVRATIKRICDLHPQLGTHLQQSLTTGNFCCYSGDSTVDWLT